jgi:hypothetical protein
MAAARALGHHAGFGQRGAGRQFQVDLGLRAVGGRHEAGRQQAGA